MTFADDSSNPNKVDVTIDLTGSGEKVQEFFFNHNDAKYTNTTPFVLTGAVTTKAIDENNQKANGYFGVQTTSRPQNTGISAPRRSPSRSHWQARI